MDRAPEASAWTIETDTPLGYTERVRETPLSQAGVLPEIDDDHTNPLTADPEPSDDVGEPDGVATALLPEETATITRADAST